MDAEQDSTGAPPFALAPRVLMSLVGAALLGTDDLRFTASILAHGFPLRRAFPRKRSGPCALAAIDSSGTAPDSHRIPCDEKTVFTCSYYATVSGGKSQPFFCRAMPFSLLKNVVFQQTGLHLRFASRSRLYASGIPGGVTCRVSNAPHMSLRLTYSKPPILLPLRFSFRFLFFSA